jgi:hypothetical protein
LAKKLISLQARELAEPSVAFMKHVVKSETLHIPRWLFSIEMLVCFVPLTLFGVAVVAAAAKGVMPIRDALLYLSVVAVGPIGLVLAFRRILRYDTALRKVTVVVLCLAAGWTLFAYASHLVVNNGPPADWWREFVVIALLPAIGVVHLLVVGSTKASTSD